MRIVLGEINGASSENHFVSPDFFNLPTAAMSRLDQRCLDSVPPNLSVVAGPRGFHIPL
jgi:hypothetical protein